MQNLVSPTTFFPNFGLVTHRITLLAVSMPSFTTVFEDTSPMILYSSNWRAGISGDDPSADRYSESSFTVTDVSETSMFFAFYGSSVAVYGARRGNHGAYHASVDNNSPLYFNGNATPDQFNQILFNSVIAIGSHNLTVVNDDNKFFDVDYITVDSNVGLDGEELIVNTYQDTHPAFNYTPTSFWTTPANVGTFLGGSGHAATQPGAKVEFSFQGKPSYVFCWHRTTAVLLHNSNPGDAIAVYGPVGPNSTSGYFVQIDNGPQSFLSANKQFYHSQQMLFFAGNLGALQHTLTIVLSDAPQTGDFAIDYVSVYTSPSLGGSFFSSNGTVAAIPTSTIGSATMNSSISSIILTCTSGNATAICSVNAKGLSPGVIVGLAVTTTVAILTTLFSIVIVWHYRRSQRTLCTSIQPPEIGSMSEPHSRTVRPFLKYPERLGFSSTFGSNSTVTHTSNMASEISARHRRNSTASLMTQPPMYQ